MPQYRDKSVGPCFCADQCPPGSHPHHNYYAQTSLDAFDRWPGWDVPLYCTHTSSTATLCNWAFETPPGGGNSVANLIKLSNPPIVFDHEYDWFIEWTRPAKPVEVVEFLFGWDEDQWPDTIPQDVRCDQDFQLSPRLPPFVTMDVTPLPPWVCSQSDLETFLGI